MAPPSTIHQCDITNTLIGEGTVLRVRKHSAYLLASDWQGGLISLVVAGLQQIKCRAGLLWREQAEGK